jgi:hypothetical protein
MTDPAAFHQPDDPALDWEHEYNENTKRVLGYMDAYITLQFGERCPTVDENCPTCKLWKLRDEFEQITK